MGAARGHHPAAPGQDELSRADARCGCGPVGDDRSTCRGAQVGLSTASVYPEGVAAAFELAARLGYDGVEVMVWTDPLTREAGALRTLSQLHGIPVLSVHAPTLLVTQRVWGTDPWEKIDRSIALADELEADTVVLHPPFRWQRDYARDFVDGVALRENDTHIGWPSRTCTRGAARARASSRPTCRTGTRCRSPTTTSPSTCRTPSTSGSDAMEMVRRARAEAAPPAPRRRRRVGTRRAPRARARHPAVRRGARDARGRRVCRPRRRRGRDPSRGGGAARARPRRGARVRPAAPRHHRPEAAAGPRPRSGRSAVRPSRCRAGA